MVNFRRQTPDQPNPFIPPAGIEELLEVRSGRLNIHIKESSLHLRILMPNRPDQAKSIGTADLGAVEISNRFIPTSDTLEEGDIFWKSSIRGSVQFSLEAEHFIEVFGSDDIFEAAIAILGLLGGIVWVDACRKDDRSDF
jgi:hypothetical protein